METKNLNIDMIPCGIYGADLKGIILDWNDEMKRITGFSRSEATGQSVDFLKYYNSTQKEGLPNLLNCNNKSSELRSYIFLETKSGEVKPIFLQISKTGNKIIFALSDLSRIENCDSIFSPVKKSAYLNLVGKDKKMRDVYKMMEMAGDSETNVLISGESGTGKELVAKGVHKISKRNSQSFIAVNCSALPETLLESELFGHVKGSFTGAYRDKKGKFEMAHRGTLFLDEIGEISPLIQVKLLRVIQDKAITKLGDNREIKIDIRIICATNKDLFEMVKKGLFREDLYYRLKVFPIETPSLKEHQNDIPLLITHFIERYNIKTKKKIQGLTRNASRLIMNYCWPGNVRELENCIEHAFVLCSKRYIDVFDLPRELRIEELRNSICHDRENIASEKLNKANTRNRKISKTELLSLLEKNYWNRTKTAEQLGISRVALWKKMKKMDILKKS